MIAIIYVQKGMSRHLLSFLPKKSDFKSNTERGTNCFPKHLCNKELSEITYFLEQVISHFLCDFKHKLRIYFAGSI